VLLAVVGPDRAVFRHPHETQEWAEKNVRPIYTRWSGLSRVAFRDYTEPGRHAGIVFGQGLSSMPRCSICSDGTTDIGGSSDDRDRARQWQLAAGQ
jgi:hypothetical protein